jgi:hypothetical protein
MRRKGGANEKRKIAPARRSSFSLPVNLLIRTTSPVPTTPYLLFRRTRARVVVGRSRFRPRVEGSFAETCLGPVLTRALVVVEFDLIEPLGGIRYKTEFTVSRVSGRFCSLTVDISQGLAEMV